MPDLAELQQAFIAALRDSEMDASGLASPARLNVYRANYAGNLAHALRLTYPAVERLVGKEFFDDWAAVYIRETPPHSGNMNDYGGGFGDFLSGFEPVATLPYLAGVARLEWALFVAAIAAEAPPMDQNALAALGQKSEAEIHFGLHPALGLVRDDFPVDAVRSASLSDDDAAFAALDMKSGPVFLLVSRSGDDVSVARLSKGEWDFLAAIGGGENLEQALAGKDFDASAALSQHLAAGNLIAG